MVLGMSFTGFALTSWSESQSSPSFNCEGELTSLERSICSEQSIAELDAKLAKTYKARKDTSEKQNELKKTQLEWLSYRNNVCSKTEFGTAERYQCLKAVYQSRLYELNTPERTEMDSDVLESQKTLSTFETENESGQNAELETIKNLQSAIIREGYMFGVPKPRNNKSPSEMTTQALTCAKSLNRSPLVKSRTCYNLTKDLGKTEIVFLESNPLCASVSINDQPLKLVVIEGDDASGLEYDDGILGVADLGNSGNGIIYNFNRDSAAFIIQNSIRLEMSDCI